MRVLSQFTVSDTWILPFLWQGVRDGGEATPV